ncbi:unnamed protein product [Caenorhabditis auriculariae]|uniref:Uncharacterized protein n=1 Tax=Caenorhabditis auriculariae TaxID=2777116 RepID=A0A8S1GR69_9PELO|nr:unnamed protein product [Caenorhabditis auriculariae]
MKKGTTSSAKLKTPRYTKKKKVTLAKIPPQNNSTSNPSSRKTSSIHTGALQENLQNIVLIDEKKLKNIPAPAPLIPLRNIKPPKNVPLADPPRDPNDGTLNDVDSIPENPTIVKTRTEKVVKPPTPKAKPTPEELEREMYFETGTSTYTAISAPLSTRLPCPPTLLSPPK